MPRFAILSHDHPFQHWDLLLESGSIARTWRLLRRPLFNEPIAAEALPDHRLRYLDYDGAVSGGRGTVKTMLQGEFTSTPASGEPCELFPSSPELTIVATCRHVTWLGRLFRVDFDRLFWVFSGELPINFDHDA